MHAVTSGLDRGLGGHSSAQTEGCADRPNPVEGGAYHGGSAEAGEARELNRLEALSDADLETVVDKGRHVHLPADWSLIWEKTPADKAYLIVDGEVSVRKGGRRSPGWVRAMSSGRWRSSTTSSARPAWSA